MAQGLVQVSFRLTPALMNSVSIKFVINLQLSNYVSQGV
jgi:hypothetical protein